MNKLLSASDLDVPPLCFLILAVISLVFNLCFPQYTAYAYSENQKFIMENRLKENAIALNKLKNEAKERKTAAKETVSEEIYSELTLEKTNKKIKSAPKPAAAAKPAAVQTAILQSSSSNGTSSRWVTVTAYSSTVDQCDSSPFITASGTRVHDGIIATNLLAFGTKVKFPSIYGDKIFTVEDRMNKRYTDRADIWFETREEAIKFGVKRLEMVIVS
jgi:3D (Asp-Asp-Asp) domain-containing protein